MDDCRLGDTVAEVTRLDLYTNPRGYVDYRSARPHRHHVTSHRLRHEKRAPDHDFVVIVENVRAIVEGACGDIVGLAGIVDESCDRSHLGDDLLDGTPGYPRVT